MRRKFTLLVLPPVATMTALVARRLMVGLVLSMFPSERKLFSGVVAPGMILGVYSAVMPITRPVFSAPDGSRITLVILKLSKKRTPLARALASSGLITLVPLAAFGLSNPAL